MGIYGRREADEPDESDSSGRFASLRDRFGRFLATLLARSRWSRARLVATADRLTTSGTDSRTLPTETDASPASGPCPSMEGFPEREYPLTYPGRELPSINPTDVVKVETGHGIRLSVPGNPEATLTSDVWMPVEP